MKYENAQNILPSSIIRELQQYVDGIYLYIPKRENNKKSWGEDSGFRQELVKRNIEIYEKFLKGISVKELAKGYYLSESSIRRIIREYKL
ncbi:CD3324 family protein [Clostridium paraputrificum]|uniref:CD3324 family protein n=1 Tax=Clostridium TaxID=1485 RepID=UPI003D33CA13